MTVRLYGIPNCDTVRKARKWLDANGITHTFHDFKREGLDPARLEAWVEAAGLDVVVNRRGTTFRKLSEAEKAALAERHTAVALLVQQPSIIKRPVVEYGADGAQGILIGFREDEWSAKLL